MIQSDLPHSRACGWRKHEHGTACSWNCPTCGGIPVNGTFSYDCLECGLRVDAISPQITLAFAEHHVCPVKVKPQHWSEDPERSARVREIFDSIPPRDWDVSIWVPTLGGDSDMRSGRLDQSDAHALIAKILDLA